MATIALDDAGVLEILEHVRSDFVSGSLDRSELKEDILAAWDFYQGYKRTSAKGSRTAVRQNAKHVASRTDELLCLLTDPEPNALMARTAMDQYLEGGDDDQSITCIVYKLHKLAAAASRREKV
jgi:hypothetical protein